MDIEDKFKGQLIGNYRLTKRLGRGGFADVYLGEHAYLPGRQVAIKVFSPLETVDEEETQHWKEQFRIEAQRLSLLNHPNIVPVLDFGFIENNTPYLLMKYAQGGSLRSRHPKGSVVPLAVIVSCMKQAAIGLQYIHDNKLIHRDIKPENLLLGDNDTVWISDIGIAVVAHKETSLITQDGSGTPQYMAPEHWDKKPRPTSDQYSLGITVYEWLCGSRPFAGSRIALEQKHKKSPPPSLCEKISYVTTELEKVLFTALAKDHARRYPSVKAFADAFEQACFPIMHSSNLIVGRKSELPQTPKAAIEVQEPVNKQEKPAGDKKASSPPQIDNNLFAPPSPRIAESPILVLGKQLKKLPAVTPDAAASPIPVAPAAAPKPMKNSNPGKQRRALAGAAVAAGAAGAAAFAAARPPVQVGGTPLGGGTPPAQGGGGSRRRSHRLLAILLVVLTVLLLAGLTLASSLRQQALSHLFPGAATTPTVTITPNNQDIADNFVITAVTGTPNAAARQVQASIISATSQQASASADATGSIPGKHATGSLQFSNLTSGNIVITVGSVTGADGVQVTFNTPLTVPPAGITVSATASVIGKAGNIMSFLRYLGAFRTDNLPVLP